MPVYKNPDFARPPSGLSAIFANADQQSFFSIPQWYELLARFGVSAGAEVRVYTDERPGSMIAVPMLISDPIERYCLTGFANFYSVEHDLIAAADADLDRGIAAIISEIK